MGTPKITFDMSKEQQEAILKKCIEREIAKTHALGLPTTHADSIGIYRLYPDGRKEYIELYKED